MSRSSTTPRPRKPDTPSGTGRELAETLGGRADGGDLQARRGARRRAETRGGAIGAPHPVQVHSLRMPGFVLSCEAVFGLPDERLVIRHDAGTSAAPYVGGTLLAARRVSEQTGPAARARQPDGVETGMAQAACQDGCRDRSIFG